MSTLLDGFAQQPVVLTLDQLRRVYEALPCGILVADHKGQISFANSSAAGLIGAQPPELIGLSVEPLLGDNRLKVTSSTMATADGLATVHTIEAQVFSGEAAKERLFLAAIVESSEDSIVGTDLDGNILSWNYAAEELFGFAATEVLGKSINIIYADGLLGDPLDILKRIRAEERIERFETWRVAKDGRRLNVLATLAAIRDARGDLQGVSGIYRDISQVKKAQEELLQAKQAAEAASRAKSEFLANMSHEIRTPMNVMLGMSSLLLETPLNEEQSEYARGVRRAAESLLGVINDILDFSKIEAGKLEIDPTDFVLEETLGEVTSMMAELASRKNLDLNLAIDPALPVVIRGDSSRVRQVLVNLAGNAIKFTERGEVTISVGRKEETAGSPHLLFEVRDTGIGIPPTVRDRIFEAFSQADGSTTRKYGGTGLGLAISRKLVDLMGGDMGLDSREGEGSVFWFTLPLIHGAANVPVASQDLSSLAGLRVLVVDDNETNRRIVKDQLRPLRISCEEAGDALQAIMRTREAAAHHVPFDLVILDYGMPGMNGVDLTRVIRSDRHLALTRLILMTSYAEKKCRDQAIEAGVDAVLDKPVRMSEFRKCLLRVAGQTAQGLAALEPIEQVPVAAPAPTMRVGKLLLVEDNADNRKLALKVLEKAGYQCDVAVNGKEAVEAVARAKYMAVLMDCQMPVMDGFQATAAIREAEGSGPRLPIIALTAHAMAGDRDKCIASGMDDYMSKPIFRDKLAAMLEKWTAQAEYASAAAAASEAAPANSDVVTVERDLEELIPDYLASRKNDVVVLGRALQSDDLDTIRVIGHGMKGSGGGYGMPRITEIGGGLERAAKETDRAQIENLLRALEEYVERVQVTYR